MHSHAVYATLSTEARIQLVRHSDGEETSKAVALGHSDVIVSGAALEAQDVSYALEAMLLNQFT